MLRWRHLLHRCDAVLHRSGSHGFLKKLNVGRQFGRGQAAWWNDGNVVSNVLGFGGRLQFDTSTEFARKAFTRAR
eukprot:COSAG06_NODE_38679_length_421_cov_0.285714_1_plen_74_part_01